MIRVWVDDWQMQCCGTPVNLGDRAEWALDEPDRNYFRSVLGPVLAQTVTHHEEHHGDEGEEFLVATGVVTGIRAVRCRYAPNNKGPANALVPVEGSVDIREVAEADGWETEETGLRFVAYLVDLDDV